MKRNFLQPTSHKKRKVLIPFTGGLDSTFLLYKNINDGNEITTFYVQLLNNGHKTEIELAHRKYIIKYFQKTFKSFGWMHDTISSKVFVDHSGSLSMTQPPIWMLFTNFVTYGQKTVEISYVLNDCAVSFLKDIKRLYKAYKPFYGREDKQPKLRFPLIKISKIEEYRALPSELLQYIWSCENPRIIQDTEKHLIYRNCGHCEPCKKEKMLYIYTNKTFKLLKNTKKLIIGEDDRDKLEQKAAEDELNIVAESPEDTPNSLVDVFKAKACKKNEFQDADDEEPQIVDGRKIGLLGNYEKNTRGLIRRSPGINPIGKKYIYANKFAANRHLVKKHTK